MISWFICPYKRRPGSKVIRYCGIDDFTDAINLDSGTWSEVEISENRSLVKVNASPSTLALIGSLPEFIRLPENIRLEALRQLAVPPRRKPRYDSTTDSIILDGPEQECESVDILNDRVQ